MMSDDKIQSLIDESPYFSRDLSWLEFNYRVLDQAKSGERSLTEKLKFMAITAANLDEFFMIRVGSLYNYLDYGKKRLDYSGLRALPLKNKIYQRTKEFVREQYRYFYDELEPQFASQNFRITRSLEELSGVEQLLVYDYFERTVFPMLTPMVYDNYHSFPLLVNKFLIFGVVTQDEQSDTHSNKISFVQIPQNLPRFFEIESEDILIFVPIEQIIRAHISKLFRNIKIVSVTLFRITRNGDFTLDESEDMDVDFLQEVKQKLKSRKTGRVVRLETETNISRWMLKLLKKRWRIDDDNIFKIPHFIDLTGLWQIVKHKSLQHLSPKSPSTVVPLACRDNDTSDIMEKLRQRDIFLHHPYNSVEPLMDLLEKAAEAPDVLAIKMTIYRLAEDSRVTKALLRAAEKGKHISVLFEVKARFDEENNIKEAKRLQEAGCFVIFGVSNLKTHTKMMLIVRKVEDEIVRYVHMGTGNYNEDTAKLYTDVGMLTTNEMYGRDVSEFFNAITGHSVPTKYEQILTAPHYMRDALIALIQKEIERAQIGDFAAVVIKVNSLQDSDLIDALYEASQAGVKVKLIVRGICCIRPQRKGLSENIEVISLVGDYLEHSRFFYFHNGGDAVIYSGSADAMVRSFDRRIESLFKINDPLCKQEAINILAYNLRDNVNAYRLDEDGSYIPKTPKEGEEPFSVHKKFYDITINEVMNARLFETEEETEKKVDTKPEIAMRIEG
ncbi:MAG: polyphosphate kinase 1 [Bernardetiaceae bacterium]|nr:polyphosphate kinase 1 [Bernardetiaceae bacterium]